MEKVLVFSLLVLASLRPASTQMFIKEGGSVTLDLMPASSDAITIIQWKFKDSILAEWAGTLLPLTHYRDNIKLDIVTGRLAMEKMTKAHEGVYSVEVNSLVQKETYNVVFINDVPKPSIWVSPVACNDADDQCTLKCEGDTTGAEPVTYSWKTDNGEWKESKRDMLITKKDHGQVKTFTCKMKNPVSEKESDLFPNRLYTKEVPKRSPVGWIFGGIVAFVAIGGGAWVLWAWKTKKWPFVKGNIDPEAPDKNGSVPGDDAAKEGLLNVIPMTNTPPEVKPGIQEGPAGTSSPPPEVKPNNPPPEEKPNNPPPEEPDSQEEPTGEPADPPKAPDT